jgi:hypothetical protein
MPVNVPAVYDVALRAGEDRALGVTRAGLFGDYYQTTADTLVFNGPCVVTGYIVTAALSANAVHATDAVAAGGAARFVVPASQPVGIYPVPPVRFNSGLYADYQGGTGTIQWIVAGA